MPKDKKKKKKKKIPDAPPNPLASLAVTYLPLDMTAETLGKLFSTCGTLRSCYVMIDEYSGESLGYGFVNFKTVTEASEAISKFNGIQLGGRYLLVGHAKNATDRAAAGDNENSIYVAGLPLNYPEDQFAHMFGAFGTVVNCKVVHKEDNIQDCGFVNFMSTEEADIAIAAMDGEVMPGHEHKLIVRKKFPKGHKMRMDEMALKHVGTKILSEMEFNERGQPIFETVRETQPGHKDTKLFVSGVPKRTTEAHLRSKFNVFGVVNEVKIIKKEDRAFTFAFIRFHNLGDAEKAIEELNDKLTLEGAKLPCSVSIAEDRPEEHEDHSGEVFIAPEVAQAAASCGLNCPRGTGHVGVVTGKVCQVYVGGLPSETTMQLIYELFAPFGGIMNIRMSFEESSTETSTFKGVAFVSFRRFEDACLAWASMHGYRFFFKGDFYRLKVRINNLDRNMKASDPRTLKSIHDNVTLRMQQEERDAAAAAAAAADAEEDEPMKDESVVEEVEADTSTAHIAEKEAALKKKIPTKRLHYAALPPPPHNFPPPSLPANPPPAKRPSAFPYTRPTPTLSAPLKEDEEWQSRAPNANLFDDFVNEDTPYTEGVADYRQMEQDPRLADPWHTTGYVGYGAGPSSGGPRGGGPPRGRAVPRGRGIPMGRGGNILRGGLGPHNQHMRFRPTY